MKVIYCPEQVRRAAKFLHKRNPAFSIREIPDIQADIMAALRHHVKVVCKCLKDGDDWHFMASGGYWILAYCIDDGAIQVDVLVDAAIGREADHKYLEK